MDADLKQAILECLSWYYEHVYDGLPEPSWVDVMMRQYCADDGIADACDCYTHIGVMLEEYLKGA